MTDCQSLFKLLFLILHEIYIIIYLFMNVFRYSLLFTPFSSYSHSFSSSSLPSFKLSARSPESSNLVSPFDHSFTQPYNYALSSFKQSTGQYYFAKTLRVQALWLTKRLDQRASKKIKWKNMKRGSLVWWVGAG